MLAGLRQHGHEPTLIDEMDATALCALSLQARKLRDRGQSELEVWAAVATPPLWRGLPAT